MFGEQGFLLMEDVLSKAEVAILKTEMQNVLKEDTPKKIFEKNGAVRSFFAPHETSPNFDGVGKLKKIVTPAVELLGSEVYIHKTKINSKSALIGDWWEWHQDFPYWHIEDGMPSPRVLTSMIFLDDVNEFNGPVFLIPGSNRAGVIGDSANDDELENENEWFRKYQRSKPYMSNLTSKLKYTIKKEMLQKWAEHKGVFSAKGRAGTVLLFDGLVFHASTSNLSPWSRDTYLITYNSVENKLFPKLNPRPSFLANQDFSPIRPIENDSLLSIARQHGIALAL